MSKFKIMNEKELQNINGGKFNAATISGLAGALYGGVVGLGSAGWLGASAVAICSAPVVAGRAAVIGVIGVGAATYSLLS